MSKSAILRGLNTLGYKHTQETKLNIGIARQLYWDNKRKNNGNKI